MSMTKLLMKLFTSGLPEKKGLFHNTLQVNYRSLFSELTLTPFITDCSTPVKYSTKSKGILCYQHQSKRKFNQTTVTSLQSKLRSLLTLQSPSIQFIRPFGFSRNCFTDDNNDETSVQRLAQLSPQLGIMYTCKVCGTRNAHSFSRKSYTDGVVIVQCENCKNNHLIADNLGWFDHIDARNVEEMLAAKGEVVNRLGDLDIPEDLLIQIKSSLSEKFQSKKDPVNSESQNEDNELNDPKKPK